MPWLRASNVFQHLGWAPPTLSKPSCFKTLLFLAAATAPPWKRRRLAWHNTQADADWHASASGVACVSSTFLAHFQVLKTPCCSPAAGSPKSWSFCRGGWCTMERSSSRRRSPSCSTCARKSRVGRTPAVSPQAGRDDGGLKNEGSWARQAGARGLAVRRTLRRRGREGRGVHDPPDPGWMSVCSLTCWWWRWRWHGGNGGWLMVVVVV
eukprot:184653-Chlamydomonas_euryale.AAC.7